MPPKPGEMDEESKEIMKMGLAKLAQEAKDVASKLESGVEAERERAMAQFSQSVKIFVSNGGSMQAAVRLITTAWSGGVGRTNQAVEKARREELWKEPVDVSALVVAIRKALDWPILTGECLYCIVTFTR
jgi:hypothetical protein